MKKVFTFLMGLLFAGSVCAENATMAAVSNCENFTINGNDAIKVGTSKNAGSMTITVGDSAVSLSFYVVGWKGTTGNLTISAPTGVTLTPNSVAPVASDIITGTDKDFTLPNEETYLVEFTLTGAKQGAIFTLSRGKRFVVWNPTYEIEKGPATGIDDVDSSLKATKIIENGKVVIKKGSRTYNVLGMVVE